MEAREFTMDTVYRKDVESNKYLQELRAKLPRKLNKLGEWFFSTDSDFELQINDMKAVLK